MKNKRGNKQSLSSIAAAVFAAALIVCFLFCMLGFKSAEVKDVTQAEEPEDIPDTINWIAKRHISDGKNVTAELNKKAVKVLWKNREIWKSDEDVFVQDALIQDVDGDGKTELILLCWKRGKFGEHKPFWVAEDENDFSQHIFVYEVSDGTVHAKWMASEIGVEADWFEWVGEHLKIVTRDGEETFWKWGSWGFVRYYPWIEVLVAGDNIIHKPILRYAAQSKMNFDFAYTGIEKVVSQADISVVVQETPLVDRPELYDDYPSFGTPHEVAKALAKAGFDMAACATNHMMDRGEEGLEKTIEAFSQAGVETVGIYSKSFTKNSDKEENGEFTGSIAGYNRNDYYLPTIVEKQGVRIAFLDFTYGLNGKSLPKDNVQAVATLYDENKVRRSIKKARENSDVMIILVHWGTEYSHDIDEEQLYWRDVFLDEKVDVVVGSHPHVVGDTDILCDRDGHEMTVFYSLGNMLSSQTEEDRRVGAMARFYIDPNRQNEVTNPELIEIETINDNGKYHVELK